MPARPAAATLAVLAAIPLRAQKDGLLLYLEPAALDPVDTILVLELRS